MKYFRPPQLEPPRLRLPITLRTTTREYLDGAVTRGELPEQNAKQKERARALIKERLAGKFPTVERNLVAPLLLELAENKSTESREAIMHLVLGADSLSWRKIWQLWAAIDPAHLNTTPVIARLSVVLANRAQKSRRFLERSAPRWLVDRNMGNEPVALPANTIAKRLLEPEEHIANHIQRSRTPIWEVCLQNEISPTEWLGRRLLPHLIRTGSHDWWQGMHRDNVFRWTSTQETHVRAAVVSRMLIEFSKLEASRSPPAQEEATFLCNWCIETIDYPESRPAAWESVSPEAKNIFERLVAQREFLKIMAEFRLRADADRADYWAQHQGELRDARFVDARTTAVCLMVFGQALVVEFGATGNASYVYQAPRQRLRTIDIPKGWDVGNFKSNHALQLGHESLRTSDRLLHHRGWQRSFDDALRIHCPSWRDSKIYRRYRR